jgi:hypothetical protein
MDPAGVSHATIKAIFEKWGISGKLFEPDGKRRTSLPPTCPECSQYNVRYSVVMADLQKLASKISGGDCSHSHGLDCTTIIAHHWDKRAAPPPPKAQEPRWISFGSLNNGRCCYAKAADFAACCLPFGHDGNHRTDHEPIDCYCKISADGRIRELCHFHEPPTVKDSLTVPEPSYRCNACRDTGQVPVGRSGSDADGNAMEFVDCDQCEPPKPRRKPTIDEHRREP